MSGLNNYQKYVMEAAFKNAVKQKPNTNANLSWYEEAGDLSKRISIASLWIDSDRIPLEAPTDLVDSIYYVKLGNISFPVLQRFNNVELTKVAGTPASFYSEHLIDSIDPSFGTGYGITLTDSTGEKIPFGLNQWVVDGESGILSFLAGVPAGYKAPFKVSFFKYVGRKGLEGLVTTDGAVPMADGYTPVNGQQIATKEYVDSNLSTTDSNIKKLTPKEPDTFKDKDLEIMWDNAVTGQLVTNTNPEIPVVYIDTEKTLRLKVPTFYKAPRGVVSVLVNNNVVYKKDITDIVEGLVETFVVDSIVNSYEDKIIAYDYYKSVNMHVVLDILSSLVPYTYSNKEPFVKIKLRFQDGSNVFYTNEITVGLDESSPVSVIKNSFFTNLESDSYISGVPTIIAGDKISYQTTLLTMKKYKKDIMGHLKLNDLYDGDIYTEKVYGNFNAPIIKAVDIVVPEGVYEEDIGVEITSRNLEAENGSLKTSYLLRVDSVSDESNRVTSLGLEEWNPKVDLNDVMELQLINGLYQWPRGDYSANGTRVSGLSLPNGPDYSGITGGERYVTLRYTLDNANGFYLEMPGSTGIVYDPETTAMLSFRTFKCKVDGQTDWLLMNTPYDGVGCPNELENKGCLVVNDSTTAKHYYTFGDKPMSGDLYIQIGIKELLDIKFPKLVVTDRK